MKPARILIADDHELFRRGLAAELTQVPGWIVAGEAANGRDAVALAQELKPDIVASRPRAGFSAPSLPRGCSF
jgi:DNA-binding NarL/FixJ family response regulator